METLDILAEIKRLAGLNEVEYEIERKAAAAKLEMRQRALDDAVRKQRGGPRETAAAAAATDTELAPAAPEPWPQEVNGRELLDELHGFIRRFVIVGKSALVALTLWIPFTYLLDVAEVSPRLAILSPTKRCGKTFLLELLRRLIFRALVASNISTAAFFRTIDLARPSLLIDEMDALPRKSERAEEIRGLLNSGHTPTSAFVVRTVKLGDDHVPRRFSTWTAIAMAAIGRLPETWEDRSIAIIMQRKRRGQQVERFNRRNVAARVQALELQRKLMRWAADNKGALQAAEPALPKALDDRAADNWELQLSIANRCGGTWPQKARDAAVDLSSTRQDSASVGEELLADIKAIFDETKSDRISSAALCAALVALELRPWGAWGRARRPLSQNQLARLLKPYLIIPVTVDWPDGSSLRGYKLTDFEEAFAIYVTDPNAPKDPDPNNKEQEPPDDADLHARASANGTGPDHGAKAPADDDLNGAGDRFTSDGEEIRNK